MKKSISSRLKEIMRERNLKQVDILNKTLPFQTKYNVRLAKNDLSQYVNGKVEPNQERVYILAKALDVSEAWLLGYDVPKQRVDKSNNEDISTIYNQLNNDRQTKVYNFAEHQLEEQNYVEEHYEEYHGQTAAGAPIEGQQPIPFVGAETVSLLVNGDSMEPKFYDGDIIEYHPQPELENGEIGVFAINGGITMKKFRRNRDMRLESLNKKYEDIVIKETDDFSILGKVIK